MQRKGNTLAFPQILFYILWIELCFFGTRKLSDNNPKTQSSTDFKTEEKWSTVQSYMGCNDHLKGLDKGRHAPKVIAIVAKNTYKYLDQKLQV